MIYSWHQDAWEHLSKARESNHISHALLVSGAAGTGKLNFTISLINSLLCESPRYGFVACGNCKSCKVQHADTHPDYYSVQLAEGKSQITIDQIREFNEFLHKSRSYEGYRVAYIDPAEALNVNAANSLLKSLEEPASNTVIVLRTSSLSTLLPTIRSRCQMVHLATPGRKQALEWLSSQETNHNPTELLDMASGKPLYALALDETEHFEKRKDFAHDLSAVLQQERSLVEIAKKWQSAAKDELLDWQIHWVQHLIKQFFTSKQQSRKSMLALPQLTDIKRLWLLHDRLLQLREIAHTSLNAQLFVENMLLSWRKLI